MKFCLDTGAHFSEEFLKYFKNTSWLFFDKVFKLCVGFFVIIYLTRYLGPERFGQWSYAQGFVGIFMALSSLGIGTIVAREIVSTPKRSDFFLGAAFFLTIASSVILFLLMIVISYLTLQDDIVTRSLVVILGFTIFFKNFCMTIEMFFRAKVKLKYTVAASSVVFVMSSILKIILIYFEANLIYFAYAALADVVVLCFGYFYVYAKQNLSVMSWRIDKKIIGNFLRAAWPLTIVSVSAFLYTKVDQIMIKHMVGNEAVGIYAAATRVSEVFYFIVGVITTSIFPKIVELRKSNWERYLFLMERLYRLAVQISLTIAIPVYFFREQIVSLLYGAQYAQASDILAILAWSVLFTSIGAVFVKMLYVEHFEKKYMYKSVLGVIFNILLNYVLIDLYGAKGAAISTIITLFVINYAYDLFDKDLRKFYFLKIKCFIPKFMQIL